MRPTVPLVTAAPCSQPVVPAGAGCAVGTEFSVNAPTTSRAEPGRASRRRAPRGSWENASRHPGISSARRQPAQRPDHMVANTGSTEPAPEPCDSAGARRGIPLERNSSRLDRGEVGLRPAFSARRSSSATSTSALRRPGLRRTRTASTRRSPAGRSAEGRPWRRRRRRGRETGSGNVGGPQDRGAYANRGGRRRARDRVTAAPPTPRGGRRRRTASSSLGRPSHRQIESSRVSTRPPDSRAAPTLRNLRHAGWQRGPRRRGCRRQLLILESVITTDRSSASRPVREPAADSGRRSDQPR